jgi:hypothetical protein
MWASSSHQNTHGMLLILINIISLVILKSFQEGSQQREEQTHTRIVNGRPASS